MAYYEPLNPQVIGPQWSPVRQESIPFDLSTELGYTFTVTGDSSSSPGPFEVQWLMSHVPENLVRGQVPFISIYPRGDEVNVGRVYRMVVPISNATVTGTGTLPGGVTAEDALRDSFDDLSVSFLPGDSGITANFSLASTEINVLQDRRILKINLLYTAFGPFNELDNSTNGVYATLESNNVIWSMGLGSITGPLGERSASLSRVSLGDVNPFWSAGTDPFFEPARYPWRREEVSRISETEPFGTRISVGIRGQNLPTTSSAISIGYMALEIVVCEENRIWYGGNSMGNLAQPVNAGFDPFAEINSIELRTASFQATGGLEPGDYSVTITLADAGNLYNLGDKPHFAALREAEPMPAPGVQGILITKWQDPDSSTDAARPLNGTIAPYTYAGDVPTLSDSGILPGISLPIDQVASHAYAKQITANVLDDSTAQQVIINNANGPEVYYPWVRFYARRFGDLSRTLRIRALSGIPGIATIDQATFDALPEIVDGWREVTLRMDSNTPSFSDTGALSSWEWDTINGSVTPENHWEVLGARSFGDPADTYGIISAVSATYNDISLPFGVETQQSFADLMLMFSQDPIPVSGLAIDVLSQEVTGIGLECATLPECIPTGIAYHHVTWDAGEIVCDTFSRAVTGGWGTADTGQAYTTTGGASTTSSVGNGTGAFIQSATGSHRETLTGVTQSDPDMYVTFSINEEATAGASLTAGFTARGTDSLNQYVLSARCNADNSMTALIERVVAGSFMTLASATVPDVQFFPNQTYEMRARLDGTSLMLRIWENGLDEPTIWHAQATDATYSSGPVGLRGNVAAAYAGDFPVIFTFDHFTSSEITVVGAHYELQRQDDVDTTWHTIMESMDLCPVGFNDYEARVGVESRYRIRLVNALRFPGPWSDEVASTLTDPGVFGVGDGNSVLIFTTNERQLGTSNLAYVMNWGRSVEEDFEFPEASTVQLQPMYQRDFVVAFRPTERGGERFTRTLLVNNSAVPTGLIRDGFTSLRDMAWEDVSYVCVRNELGDRWLATVLVPSGTIQRNRRLYLATVDIIEVTDTPSTVTIEEFNGA